MRMMLRVTVPVAGGNKAIQEGVLQKTISAAMDRLKPESAYFYSDGGVRSSIMIFNMRDTSEIPVIAEPFFMGLDASVEFIPVMNAKELKKALSKI